MKKRASLLFLFASIFVHKVLSNNFHSMQQHFCEIPDTDRRCSPSEFAARVRWRAYFPSRDCRRSSIVSATAIGYRSTRLHIKRIEQQQHHSKIRQVRGQSIRRGHTTIPPAVPEVDSSFVVLTLSLPVS